MSNEILEYKKEERGISPLIKDGFEDMEFERTIHERIIIKK